MADEEACGFRAMNLLYGPMAVRGAPVPEYAHPAWNDTSRAFTSSGLKSAVLKGTLLCNFYRGPFHSGAHGYHLQEAATKLAATISSEELIQLSPDYAYDMRLDPDHLMTAQDIADAPGVATRLPQDALACFRSATINQCQQVPCETIFFCDL